MPWGYVVNSLAVVLLVGVLATLGFRSIQAFSEDDWARFRRVLAVALGIASAVSTALISPLLSSGFLSGVGELVLLSLFWTAIAGLPAAVVVALIVCQIRSASRHLDAA